MIPLRTQFLSFRSRATRHVTPHTTIYHLKSNISTRLGVVVPIKVNKRATTRNSFKRLAYDTAWKIIKDKNLDCIIIFKPLALPKGKPSQDLILSEIRSLEFN